jgi:hypothetical protein
MVILAGFGHGFHEARQQRHAGVIRHGVSPNLFPSSVSPSLSPSATQIAPDHAGRLRTSKGKTSLSFQGGCGRWRTPLDGIMPDIVPPLALAKAFSRSGFGRIFPLFS